MISAYAVKSYISDARAFYEYIKSKIPSFEDLYETWEVNNRHNFEVSARDLNLKHKNLNESVLDCQNHKVIEYNYYVDDILQSSPPYRPDLKDLSSGPDDEWDYFNAEQFEMGSTNGSITHNNPESDSTPEASNPILGFFHQLQTAFNPIQAAMLFNPFIFANPPINFEFLRSRPRPEDEQEKKQVSFRLYQSS